MRITMIETVMGMEVHITEAAITGVGTTAGRTKNAANSLCSICAKLKEKERMWYRGLITLVVLGTLAVTSAQAHDPSLHKGKSTVGTVTSITENALELQTGTGRMMVTFQPETKFERGDESVTRQAIHVGDQVTVFGTKLATGELVAREVLLAPSKKCAAMESSSVPAEASEEQARVEQK